MNKKTWLWAIISAILAILSVSAIVSQSREFSLDLILDFIKNADLRWLVLTLLSMFGFIWFEGCAIVRIAQALGYHQSTAKGTIYGAADVYFSAITPSASGGQPASAYFMIRDGMSASAVTTILLLNLIMYSAALLSFGILSFVTGFEVFTAFSLVSRIMILLGAVIMIALSFLFYMLLWHGSFLHRICLAGISFLERIHLMHHGDRRRARLEHTMEEYRDCTRLIAENRRMLVDAYILNMLQRLSQLGVTFLIFKAAGSSNEKALQALITQCFVTLGSNCAPVPGAVGVADYIMLDGFQNLVGEVQKVTMELICRGITFYGCMITSVLLVIVGYLTRKRRERKC